MTRLRISHKSDEETRGRAIYISSVNNAAYPLATSSRRGRATLPYFIYVYKILFCAWRRRLTCRRPWTARRPIKTRRAGRAPWKSGAAAATTIKWPRTSIDIGVYSRPTQLLPPLRDHPTAFPAGGWCGPCVTRHCRIYSGGPAG